LKAVRVKKVICTLPNASENINGVVFARAADGSVSAVVSAESAALFDGIPGYSVSDVMKAPKEAPAV
jgi:hypothetical protein